MKIAFIDTVHQSLQNLLEAKNLDCHHFYDANREELKTLLSDYEGIVIRSRITLDADFLNHCKSLKFIARSGAGMENIDLNFCHQNNIICFNSPEGNRDAVGEHAIGMLLMLMNKLNHCDAEVRNGIWRREENRGFEIAQKTIGIIGYGNMGSAFANKLIGFDCKIFVYDKYKLNINDTNVTQVSYNDLLECSDVISIHVPLTEETTYMIDEKFISKMKKPFYLINTSRGKNVNTQALVNGLQSGKILGACLDVLEYEKSSFENLDLKALPSPMQYLIQCNKVVLSPHVAGWTKESYEKLSLYLAKKIIAHFNL